MPQAHLKLIDTSSWAEVSHRSGYEREQLQKPG